MRNLDRIEDLKDAVKNESSVDPDIILLLDALKVMKKVAVEFHLAEGLDKFGKKLNFLEAEKQVIGEFENMMRHF